MRVWSDTPRKLRAWVATDFDGVNWHASPAMARTLKANTGPSPGDEGLADVHGDTFVVPPSGATSPSGTPPAPMHVLLVGVVSGSIPAPQRVVMARVPTRDRTLGVDATGLLTPELPSGAFYGVLAGGPEQAAAPDERSLVVPPDLDGRLGELAKELTASATTNAQRIDHTKQYLQTHLTYSLRVGRFRSKRQWLAEFVFEKRRGWCTYFASAAAVLLRLEGVPTRFVSGFLLRDRLLRGGHYVVRQSDAHAWVEAWIPGVGWVEVDATPAGGYDEAHGGLEPGWLEGVREWVRGLGGRLEAVDWKAMPRLLWAEARALAMRADGAKAFSMAFWILVIGLATWIAHRLWARRPDQGADVPVAPGLELAVLLGLLDQAWTRHGVRRPPSCTPLEHVAQIPPGRVPPALVDVGREIVERYYLVRFAGKPISSDEIQSLELAFKTVCGPRRFALADTPKG
jgi:transglutaminase-like putative cysteine protease